MGKIEIEAAIISTLFTVTLVVIGIFIEIAIIKYLIRDAVNYFFNMKEYYDSRNTIDEIQQDIIRQHPKENGRE